MFLSLVVVLWCVDAGELIRILMDNGLQYGAKCVCIGAVDLDIVRGVADGAGDGGVVYVVEKDKGKLDELEELRKQRYGNIKPFYSPLLERIPYLPNGEFNIALLYHTLERVKPYYLTLLNETNRILRRDGKAIVVSSVKGLLSRDGIQEKDFDEAVSTTPLKLEYKVRKGKEIIAVFKRVLSDK